MDPNSVKDVGRDVLIFIGQFFVLLLCIAFISFSYEVNIVPDKKVAEDFNVTTCTVVAKTVATAGKVIHSYRAQFLVAYLADNKQFKSVASANGLDYSFTTDLASQQEFLDEFNTGGQYSCWYDPQQPTTVVLVLRHSWTSTFPLLVPSVVGLIMLFYMFKAIFSWIEALVRMRNNKL